MKKIVYIALSLLFVLSLSVPAFAFTVNDVNSPLISIVDGDLHIGTIKTSELTPEGKDFMREWLSSDYGVVAINNSKQLVFTIVRDNYNLLDLIDNGKTVKLVSKTSTKINTEYVIFNSDGSFLRHSDGGYTQDSTVVTFYLLGSTFINKIRPDIKTKLNSTNTIDYQIMNITDDDGLLEQSEDPDPNPTLPDLPTIGKIDHDLVPYDTTIWNSFISKVKADIGNIVNVGFILFAFIMSIYVIISIVRKFSRS